MTARKAADGKPSRRAAPATAPDDAGAWLDEPGRAEDLAGYLARMPAAVNEVSSRYAMETGRATALLEEAASRGLARRDHRGRWHATASSGAAIPRWENLGPIIENLLHAYLTKYGNKATSGIRATAPLQREMGEMRAALNDLRTGAFQAGRRW